MHRAQHLVPDAAGAVRAVDGGSNVLYDVFYVLTRFYMNFVVLELCWCVAHLPPPLVPLAGFPSFC